MRSSVDALMAKIGHEHHEIGLRDESRMPIGKPVSPDRHPAAPNKSDFHHPRHRASRSW